MGLVFGKPFKYVNNMKRNRGGPYVTQPATDLTRWRLECVDGRQRWSYVQSGEVRDQKLAERRAVGLDVSDLAPPLRRATTSQEALHNTLEFAMKLQTEDGHWCGDYGGPLFVMPGLVIVCYITGTTFNEWQTAEMIRYMRSVECPDGGWGLHTEGPPTVYGCAMNYVMLRILGLSPDDPLLVRARNLLHKLGSATAIPSWGKFVLSLCNLYSWDGLHNLFPEMWTLPAWIPIHPSKIWCHCRQVYLPMAYFYGVKFSAPENDLIRSLRKEIYSTDWDAIDWPSQRNNISSADLYTPHSWLLDIGYYFLDWYEMYHLKSWRENAIEMIYDHVCADDDFTNCISIGPISKTFNMLVRWHKDGPDHPKFKEHQARVTDYLWLGRDGMKMQGTNGSQLWDTAFLLQAVLESKADEMKQYERNLDAGHKWLKLTQIPDNPPSYETYFRQMNKGGFPFSTRDCGWIVSDCCAEGLKTAMLLQEKCPFLTEHISTERLYDGIDVLLNMRNEDNGFSSYETMRGGKLLEKMNPAEVFGDIMIDYTYVECTSSVIQALSHFTQQYPEYRGDEIKDTLDKALEFIARKQRPDGSWFGSWGVCFTYGAWFGLEAFAAMGHRYDSGGRPSVTVKKACDWLVSHRLEDGGWGENFEACELGEYMPAEKSQVVNTAFALLGLMAVRYPDIDVLKKGIRILMQRQCDNGDFPLENVTGVFNKSCAIHYDNYPIIFPLWAMGRFVDLYPDDPLAKKQ